MTSIMESTDHSHASAVGRLPLAHAPGSRAGRIHRAGILGLVIGSALAGAAWSQPDTPAVDASHAEPTTAALFEGLLAAQSAQDVDGLMAYFSPDLTVYADATIGTEHAGFDALKDVFAESMPAWGDGRTYPVQIVGVPDSAVVAFVTTPEVWGAELRILAAADLDEGQVVRWVDYFDSTPYPADEFAGIRTPQEDFPTSFREADVAGDASPRIADVATRMQAALGAGDAAALGAMLTDDAVYEDVALRTQVVGRSSIEAYLARLGPDAPFGDGATLRHVVGGDMGGGFEWIGGAGTEAVIGLTALELDPDGKVSRVTTSYDGRQLGVEAARLLAVLALQP